MLSCKQGWGVLKIATETTTCWWDPFLILLTKILKTTRTTLNQHIHIEPDRPRNIGFEGGSRWTAPKPPEPLGNLAVPTELPLSHYQHPSSGAVPIGTSWDQKKRRLSPSLCPLPCLVSGKGAWQQGLGPQINPFTPQICSCELQKSNP